MNENIDIKIAYILGKLDAFNRVLKLLDSQPENDSYASIKMSLQPTVETLEATLDVIRRGKHGNACLRQLADDRNDD